MIETAQFIKSKQFDPLNGGPNGLNGIGFHTGCDAIDLRPPLPAAICRSASIRDTCRYRDVDLTKE
jgi:hypothetical protein